MREKSWKLRRVVLEESRGELRESVGDLRLVGENGGSSAWVGGAMTSSPKVSERRKVNSGGELEVGVVIVIGGGRG